MNDDGVWNFRLTFLQKAELAKFASTTINELERLMPGAIDRHATEISAVFENAFKHKAKTAYRAMHDAFDAKIKAEKEKEAAAHLAFTKSLEGLEPHELLMKLLGD